MFFTIYENRNKWKYKQGYHIFFLVLIKPAVIKVPGISTIILFVLVLQDIFFFQLIFKLFFVLFHSLATRSMDGEKSVIVDSCRKKKKKNSFCGCKEAPRLCLWVQWRTIYIKFGYVRKCDIATR